MKKNVYLRSFLRYTTLNVCSMIALSCYILADTYFISKGVGVNGLTALNLAIPVYSTINGLGLMTGMGSATKYAVLQSQGETKQANIVFTNAVKMWGVFSAVFVLAGLFFPNR